jgi:hypothetical protein
VNAQLSIGAIGPNAAFSVMDEIDRAYKSIGEFVVTFQWIENTYREIGWFILDPGRKQWPPPMALRKETNRDLIDAVTRLFCELVDKYDLPTSLDRKADMLVLQKQFHELRRYRNSLMHSAFAEVKAGGEVIGLLRSKPKPIVDSDTGEIFFDNEPFTEERVHVKLREIAEAAFRLGQHYTQLIHWAPFERFRERT